MTIEELKMHCEKQINLCSKLNNYKHLEEHQLILSLIEENARLNDKEREKEEFINYLQEELNVQIQEESVGCETTNKKYILEEILQKYKKIIEVLDERN